MNASSTETIIKSRQELDICSDSIFNIRDYIRWYIIFAARNSLKQHLSFFNLKTERYIRYTDT